jgi:hypothetical protein
MAGLCFCRNGDWTLRRKSDGRGCLPPLMAKTEVVHNVSVSQIHHFLEILQIESLTFT